MSIRILFAITILISTGIGLAIRLLDHERLSALGSILSGAGSILAVLWFSAGLRYQSRQLEDQRLQFVAQFEYLKESGRRDSLLLVQDILIRAEEKATRQAEINSISELPAKYTAVTELKPILESVNPEEVLLAFTSWNKKEVAALTLLQGIKSAAEIYLRGTAALDIDYSQPADQFYLSYNSRFAGEPFFNSVSGAASILSEIMVRLQPARKAALIACLAAMSKAISPDVIKMDKLQKDIAEQKNHGHPLPAIAADL